MSGTAKQAPNPRLQEQRLQCKALCSFLSEIITTSPQVLLLSLCDFNPSMSRTHNMFTSLGDASLKAELCILARSSTPFPL